MVQWFEWLYVQLEDMGSKPALSKCLFSHGVQDGGEINEKLLIKKSSVSTYSGREQDDVLLGAIPGLNKQSMETKN